MAASRELPIVWAVTKGSLLNKLILVPLALLLSAFWPASIHYLLLAGGLYLCYEGAEKVMEWILAAFGKQGHDPHATATPTQDVVAQEKAKIRGAITTDFVLSAEIVVLSLGALQEMSQSFINTVVALSFIAVFLTFAVYGIVAIIVKMDDVGLHFQRTKTGALAGVGRGLLWLAPKILKVLSVVGTLAMFVVGGHIWVSHVGGIGEVVHHAVAWFPQSGAVVAEYLLEIVTGLILGMAAVLVAHPLTTLWQRLRGSSAAGH